MVLGFRWNHTKHCIEHSKMRCMNGKGIVRYEFFLKTLNVCNLMGQFTGKQRLFIIMQEL